MEDAHIKSAKASCGCTSPEVPVRYQDLAKGLRCGQSRYGALRRAAGRDDHVDFDKPFPAEVQLHIHCYIRRDVVLEPGVVNFRAAQGSAAEQRVSVRYAGRPDWQIERVESANPSITGKVMEIARGNGLVTYDLTVNLAADAKPATRAMNST